MEILPSDWLVGVGRYELVVNCLRLQRVSDRKAVEFGVWAGGVTVFTLFDQLVSKREVCECN